MRLPSTYAPTRPATPALICTTVPPAKSSAPSPQTGQGRLVLRLTPLGVAQLLGDVAEFRLVPVDAAAHVEEDFLGGGDGALLGHGLQAALCQDGLGRADTHSHTGQELLLRPEASEYPLQLVPQR